MVPHLTTALTGPLLELEKTFLDKATEIEQWMRVQWQDHLPPFYGSTDLRNSGFKLAPVDLNLFPGGFNNLNDAFLPLCVQAAQSAIERLCPDASRLLLIPENHTRNQFYLQNVAKLVSILRLTGLKVRIGSLLPDIVEPTTLELANGSTLTLEPLVREGGRLGVAGFDPCAVLLNNDLSGGVPAVLQGLEDQWVIPPVHAGWHSRRKSKHAECYDRVAREFAAAIGIDPWRINPEFGVCGQINFQERTGEECLAAQVDALLGRIREKYREYEVTDEPFVVVKADAGTYGMGVMTVKDASEVVGLNRRQRNKMAVVKEGLEVHEVIIQEGVHTFETVDGAVAEPVVYMMDHYVVGGFYRVHTERGRDENLNAPGMHFKPLAFETCCTLPDVAQGPDAPPNRFYAYGVVARLALLAASVEIEETEPAADVAELAALG
ncbi:glutamate--cysteine ligase [Pseudothauera rhizosphaerae]|uniref:Glutamate--cysteine ligase n=1 Tax=Pseudothauera rhizosphaerae TaxID=2565932 RepID=A0A4S4AQH2_9RHOO|nr:glutamate--cysteine ligase [Pseudothauera rhizosphaerae]THF62001.1 glutamate--cysteine ligase [Pseudothauera rhizosphaerae]